MQTEESVQERWDRWIDSPYSSRDKLVVHPDDWQECGCPLSYRGLPIKPLGIRITTQ
jgi:hypothetical protein